MDYERVKGLLKFYRMENPPTRYSSFLEIKDKEKFYQNYCSDKKFLVDIIAYCLMPTHIHLILTQLKKEGISIFMGNVLNSYTRYFNTKYKRKGPLWQSRFKNIGVQTDEQLLHLTRYLHLNPVSDNLVKKPEDWKLSSYREFLGEADEDKKICNYTKHLNIEPESYKEFVLSRIDYQKEISRIKALCLE